MGDGRAYSGVVQGPTKPTGFKGSKARELGALEVEGGSGDKRPSAERQ